jgi:hypothetical protein
VGTIQTLRPNATAAGSSDFTNVVGATYHASTSDSLDTSYVYKTATGNKTITFEAGTYTLPANNKVGRWRVGVRVKFDQPDSWNYTFWMRVGTSGTTRKVTATRTSKNASIATYYTAWQVPSAAPAADGTLDWTQAEIDSIQILLKDSGNWAFGNKWYEAFVELDIIDRPTVTVNSAATATTRPPISFNYADGNGDPQTKYEVKIFDSATYGGGGFSPDTSTPYWTSGVIEGSEPVAQPPNVGLINGTTYRAYVRVAHSASGDGDYWSAWANNTAWVVSVTAPTIPTPTFTWNTANQRVNLSLNGVAPPANTAQLFRIEKSVDGGTTWTPVRGSTAIVPDGTYDSLTYDYEAVRGITMRYRVRALGTSTLTGDDVSSAWGTTQTVVTTNDGKWWLKAVTDSAKNMGGVRVLEGPEVTIEQPSLVARPLGLSGAVVVTGAIGLDDGTYLIDSAGTTEIAALEAIIDHQGVLLVQDPFGTHKFIKIVSRTATILGTSSAPRKAWSVGYIAVPEPAAE